MTRKTKIYWESERGSLLNGTQGFLLLCVPLEAASISPPSLVEHLCDVTPVYRNQLGDTMLSLRIIPGNSLYSTDSHSVLSWPSLD